MNRPISLLCALGVMACGGSDNRSAQDPSTQTTSTQTTSATTTDREPIPMPEMPPSPQPSATPTITRAPPTPTPTEPTPSPTPPSTDMRLTPPPNTTPPAGPPPNATKIAAEVRRGLAADATLSVSARSVRVSVNRGKITLRGTVGSEQERSAVEAHARRTPGVTDVDNQLEVRK